MSVVSLGYLQEKRTRNVLEALERGTLPETVEGTPSFAERIEVVGRFGMWALLTWSFVNSLASRLVGKRVLEVFSGTGWLAWALEEKGVRVIATDDYSWEFPTPPRVPVLRMDAVQAVESFRRDVDVLLMCWPPPSLAPVKALLRWPPNKMVVYIGEPAGGCTAPDTFFELFKVVETIPIPQWEGIHDQCYIGFRTFSRTARRRGDRV